ncbi:MAG: circularly permuted type 2 ATP-grasp protein [Janthinobacterium lividum]
MLLSDYPSGDDRYDEMLDQHGVVRAHWRALVEQLKLGSAGQMQQRVEFVRRQILENGVTYNLYTSPQASERPWQLDPLPLVLPADEYQQLARAVAQRARLLDRMLADLYGPQTLLAAGLLPPGMLYGHPDFLWPCEGLVPPHGRFLHFYAVDVARSPDGRWWAIADRTQAPSGAGYALENRLIVSRVFPELFQGLKIEHLANFFRTVRESLEFFAPRDGATPLIVLLTPGPYSETYFEHAYLARYLGLPLVEGQDLTVRGETVYLKTLTGLQRVHAILRRMDDDYCDPLELRGDSTLGVPGLLQAARAGRVLIANALGSGLVESGSILGFLPAICEHLLGEPLALPSVATWWCGEAPALEYVIAHLDEMVVKPTYPSTSRAAVLGREVQGAAREALIESMRKQPRAFVAQELIHVSQAPVVADRPDHRLAGHSVGLRLYAAATPDGGYMVMPGGLSRVSGSPSGQLLSMQRGGSSKDTWVLSEAPVSTFSLLKLTVTSRDLLRSSSNLSSRVVENLFWFGRYTTRCDDTARLLRVALARFDDASPGALQAREAALALCRWLALLPELEEDEPAPPVEPLLLTAIADADEPTSLAANLRRLLWTATQVRERLSLDNWLALNQIHPPFATEAAAVVVEPRSGVGDGDTGDFDSGDVQAMAAAVAPASPTPPAPAGPAGPAGPEATPPAPAAALTSPAEALAFLDRMLIFCASMAGFAMDCMTRDHGWRFLVIGRHAERLAFLSTSFAHFLQQAPLPAWGSLDWLLEVADSIITYRSRYRAQPQLLPVLDLIVFDDTNPHGVAFQLVQLITYLDQLSDGLDLDRADASGALPGLLQQLRSFDLARLEHDQHAGCLALAALLDETADAAWALCDRLAMRHFSHVDDVSRQTLAA